MGILDRIAGTLDELTGEGRAAIADEVARARALASDGDAEGAETKLLEITRKAPQAAEAFLALGELRARRGALDEAVAPLGRAVDLDTGSPEAWCALGEALAALGLTDPARDALRRTLALAIDAGLRRRATAALGQVHARAGNLTHAARELRKAIEMAPPGTVDDHGLALDYGRVLARLGEREASEWLTRAARAENATPAVFAEAAAVASDAARAEALLREGLGRAPGDVALRLALVRLLLDAGRPVEAVALAESTTAEAPQEPRAWRAAREAGTRSVSRRRPRPSSRSRSARRIARRWRRSPRSNRRFPRSATSSRGEPATRTCWRSAAWPPTRRAAGSSPAPARPRRRRPDSSRGCSPGRTISRAARPRWWAWRRRPDAPPRRSTAPCSSP